MMTHTVEEINKAFEQHQLYLEYREWLVDLERSVEAPPEGIRFSLKDLQEADLQNTDLWKADLKDANLQGANLECAFLYRANLTGADLKNANLKNAVLFYANFSGADLRGSNWQESNFKDAVFDENTLYDGDILKGIELRKVC